MRLPACQFVFSVQPLTSSRVLGVRESVSTGKCTTTRAFTTGKGNGRKSLAVWLRGVVQP